MDIKTLAKQLCPENNHLNNCHVWLEQQLEKFGQECFVAGKIEAYEDASKLTEAECFAKARSLREEMKPWDEDTEDTKLNRSTMRSIDRREVE